jgi:serine/threonine-protein kinase
MSPEQCMGKQVDARSDLFSAGVVLYLMLTGEKPFAGIAFMETMQQILNVDPVLPSTRNPDLDSRWDGIVSKALAKHVDDRYQSAADFQQALRAIGDYQTMNMQSIKTSQRQLWLGIGLVVAALVGGGYWWKTQSQAVISEKQAPIIATTTTVNVEPAITLSFDQQLKQLLADYQCDGLEYTIDEQETIAVSGYVSTVEQQGLRTLLTQLAEANNKRLIMQLTPMRAENCELMTALQPFVKRNQLEKRGLQIEASQHGPMFVQGERPVFEVITPDFNGYLYVDYFMVDGKVFHLTPTNNELQQQTDAQRQVLIGNQGTTRQWQVVEPYGKEIMSVIVSERPLFEELGDDIESSESYLAKLRLALFEKEGTMLVADYFVITTIALDNAEIATE